MRDINFFETQVKEKKETKSDKRIIFYAIGIFIIFSFTAYSIYNLFRIRQEKQVISKLRATAEDPALTKKVEEIKVKENEIQAFRESVDVMKNLDEKIAEKDIIGEELLNTISLRMPKDLILTSLNVGNNEIQIQGVAQDKWAVAEFSEGLKDIEESEDIFVSNITTEEGYYSFTITITLKDVSDDGEEEIIEEETEEDDNKETEDDNEGTN